MRGHASRAHMFNQALAASHCFISKSGTSHGEMLYSQKTLLGGMARDFDETHQDLWVDPAMKMNLQK